MNKAFFDFVCFQTWGWKSLNIDLFISHLQIHRFFCPSALKLSIFVSHLSNMVMKKPIYRPFLSVIFQRWWWKSLNIDFFSKRTSSYYHGKCSQKSLILILVLCVVPCTSQDSSLPETPICKKKKTRVWLSLSLPPPHPPPYPRYVLLFSFLPRSFSLPLRETNSLPPPPPPQKKKNFHSAYLMP